MSYTKFIAWPSNARSAAQAYVTGINNHSQTTYGERFAATWYPRQDKKGRWIAPYFGEPKRVPTGAIVESKSFSDMRATAQFVEATSIEWPEDV